MRPPLGTTPVKAIEARVTHYTFRLGARGAPNLERQARGAPDLERQARGAPNLERPSMGAGG
jgi:hypothetical protein